MTNGHVYVDWEIVDMSDDAVCLLNPGTRERVWVPKSCCEDPDILEVGDDGVYVQKWIADKKGMDYDE